MNFVRMVKFKSILMLSLLFLVASSVAQELAFEAGQEVFARYSARWKTGKIITVADGKYQVQLKGYSNPVWVKADNVKPAKKSGPWLVGDFVAVREPNGVLYRGSIIAEEAGKFQIKYDWDNSEAWVTPDRIVAAAGVD